jgi:exosortase K
MVRCVGQGARRLWAPAVRWRVIGLAVVAAVLIAGKTYYRHASADDLRPILAPTAGLVSAVTGFDFVYEAGQGWVSRDAAFIIEPGCAGVNFMLAAFVVLAIAWSRRMRAPASAAAVVSVALGVAFGAALLVNTTRLAIAIGLHVGTIDARGIDPARLHHIEGIVVYLGGLCGLYAAARAVDRVRHERGCRALAA